MTDEQVKINHLRIMDDQLQFTLDAWMGVCSEMRDLRAENKRLRAAIERPTSAVNADQSQLDKCSNFDAAYALAMRALGNADGSSGDVQPEAAASTEDGGTLLDCAHVCADCPNALDDCFPIDSLTCDIKPKPARYPLRVLEGYDHND